MRGQRAGLSRQHAEGGGLRYGAEGLPRLPQALQGLKAKGTPAGFALGNATGDGNWTHWLVWAHGGKMVDAKNNVVINSPETIAALEYAKQLYETFIPGTLSWLDPNNNKAFLDGQISLTANGISIYLRREERTDPKVKEMASGHLARELPGRAGRQDRPSSTSSSR